VKDRFGREVRYLRISVTDRCNLRCAYCAPAHRAPLAGRLDILTLEEIARVAAVAAGLGIAKLRVTGGEPLLRRGVVDLISRLVKIPGIEEVSLSTNGVLLERYARALREAGVRRINVSLDTLRPDRFARITGTGEEAFGAVLAGIEAALAAGIPSLRLNAVLMRGVNDDEIEPLARLSLGRPIAVRFIELMPLDDWCRPASRCSLVPSSEVLERLRTIADLVPEPSGPLDGPARTFRFRGAPGTVGLIAPVTEPFCSSCNRLRLTAEGKLKPCLLAPDLLDVRALLRAPDVTDAGLAGAICEAIARKSLAHGHSRKESFQGIGG